MSLEYFADGSPDCPLLLLYGRAPGVVRSLIGALGTLSRHQLELHAFPGVEPLGGCRVTAKATDEDVGIYRVRPTAFRWELTPSGWEQVAGLLEPFCESRDADGFQWLEPNRGSTTPRRISFIISDSRRW